MAYFQDKRIGLNTHQVNNRPEETIDGQPYQHNPKQQPITARYMLGDGYYAIATNRIPRNFDVQAAVEELRAKVQRTTPTSTRKVSNVSESSSEKS